MKELTKDCYIVPKKEYEELQDKIHSLEKDLFEEKERTASKQIVFEIRMDRGFYDISETLIYTNLPITSSLKYSIEKLYTEHFRKYIKEHFLNQFEEFNKLPWYKKIFYTFNI